MKKAVLWDFGGVILTYNVTGSFDSAERAAEVGPCVFLDDLGINLKPAAAMGMTTIKVTSAEAAIRDLGTVLGLS